MKKLLVLGLAVVMVVAFTLPASAFESVFGGYWRTRAFIQENFSGDDDFGNPSDSGVSRIDTRTRLYYTAILNDNLKLVNKFEWNNTWGDAVGGDFGADGTGILRIKQSYVDANIGPVRLKVGQHDLLLARGFIYADEQSGATLSFKIGDVLIPLTYTKGAEGGTQKQSLDEEIFSLYPVFNIGDNFTLNPFITYAYSDSGGGRNFTFGQNAAQVAGVTADGFSLYWLGLNLDATLGSFNLWGTAVYLGGDIDDATPGASDLDVKAWLGAAGLSVPLGPASLHGQFFYASGDDNATDSDAEAFFGIGGGGVGWAYYWAEIMGLGVFDNQASAGSSGGDVSNQWAANIGATIKPMEKLSLTGDIWYSALVEDNQNNDDTLGIEVDLKATYQLTEGLNLDLVGAYLFADDATVIGTNPTSNDDDPWEIGTRLSLSF